MNKRNMERTLASCALLGMGAGCGDASTFSETTDDVAESREAIIENTEDWDWIGSHTRATDPIYNLFGAGDVRNSVTAANAVASIGGCTAFLVSRNLIVTADHCFRNATGTLPSSFTTTATFLGDTATAAAFTCRGPIQVDPAADLVSLRCDADATGRFPGDLVTPLRVSSTAPLHGDDLFAISYNCRCDHWATGCSTTGVPGAAWQLAGAGPCNGPDGFGGLYRLLSPGGTGQTHENRIRHCEVNNANARWTSKGALRRGFNNNCDSLTGSSGGPVFSRTSGSVIGVNSHWHHTGGTYNSASEAWKWMRQADRNGGGTLEGAEVARKFEWLLFTTDGGGERRCRANQAVAGFECEGDDCDDVRILCEPVPGGTGVTRITEWFSEEAGTFEGCTGNEVMVGIECRGDFCDDMRMRCAAVTAVSSCETTGSFSDGSGPFVDLGNRFVRRALCSGSHCDNVAFEVCRVNAGLATCQGACGGRASAGCFCDAACDGFGDCCADVVAMCR